MLVSVIVAFHCLSAAGAQLVDCCLGCCYHDNTLIVATAAEIYVGIVSLKWKGIGCHYLVFESLDITGCVGAPINRSFFLLLQLIETLECQSLKMLFRRSSL